MRDQVRAVAAGAQETIVVTTSGSSGYPKAVVLGRAALLASARATADRIGEGAWLLALPAGYIAGIQVQLRSLLAGHEPAVIDGSFSPPAFAAAAATMAAPGIPRYTSLVPAQLTSLLDAVDAGHRELAHALRSFEAILIGGQALAPALAERAVQAGARIVRTYGSSETAGGCVYDGVALDGVRLRARAGEIEIAGSVLADGYQDDPVLTAARFVLDDGERWYRTGDIGEVVGGVLRITGRADNVIISGGVNVSLDRVEQLVRTIPGHETDVVIPVTDPRWGQASLVITTSPTADEETLRAVVAEHIGMPARPRSVIVASELPLLPSGKPDRAALRERYGS